ncbi:putative methyltransferase [Erwinia pyrifoliae DSM 12163]|nr:methyltransferase [Erwinia pyrifoliae]CAX56484.1 uncharacterized protein EpC_27050 [Erwinia pyrifoliae Ep1/96]CAY75319.1 putative methyltransferase [Erwinia pyrifoliae DSM 12163]
MSLPQALRHRILQRAADRLHANGVFVQFQYTSMCETLLSIYFACNRTRVLANLPPRGFITGARLPVNKLLLTPCGKLRRFAMLNLWAKRRRK